MPLGLFGEKYQALPQDQDAGDIPTAFFMDNDGDTPPVEASAQKEWITPAQWVFRKVMHGNSTSSTPPGEQNALQRFWSNRFGNNPAEEDEVEPGDLISQPGEPRVLMAASCAPQVISFTVPLDVKPGKPLRVTGKNGSIEVVVPSDAVPGKPCKVSIRPKMDRVLEVTVPEHAITGDPVRFEGPESREIFAKVPAGKRPGDKFQVFPPVVMVQVPPGVRSGDRLGFQSLDGRTVTRAAPEELMPGDYFPVYL
mmetsp:Transcript_11435/g.25928  ORF Transcript_11435/g.25928 Transcript_11435/m.25928 type:complete len:253 (+) Transcript_11435:63-821(+)